MQFVSDGRFSSEASTESIFFPYDFISNGLQDFLRIISLCFLQSSKQLL